MHVKAHIDHSGVMKSLFSKRLPLCLCILLGAAHATAGTAKLSPCPDSPNCVSSQHPESARFVEPLQYTGSLSRARQRLIEILEDTPRVRLITVETDYIHAEFRSSLFKFVDDVEFYFPPGETIIHVRSASRTGYYDFGVNRRRVERLRSKFEKNLKP